MAGVVVPFAASFNGERLIRSVCPLSLVTPFVTARSVVVGVLSALCCVLLPNAGTPRQFTALEILAAFRERRSELE